MHVLGLKGSDLIAMNSEVGEYVERLYNSAKANHEKAADFRTGVNGALSESPFPSLL